MPGETIEGIVRGIRSVTVRYNDSNGRSDSPTLVELTLGSKRTVLFEGSLPIRPGDYVLVYITGESQLSQKERMILNTYSLMPPDPQFARKIRLCSPEGQPLKPPVTYEIRSIL